MPQAPGLWCGGPGRRRRQVHGNPAALLRRSEDIAVKYFFHTFGCRVNQYETQALREKLLSDGVSSAVQDFEGADVCVVNTCTVTEEADKDALTLLRRIARRNPAARLVVTGCLASRDPEVILQAAPAAVVEAKENIPAMLGCSAGGGLAGVRGLEGRSRAFVKVQDGCNMNCAFCIIPSVRPRLSCKPIAELEAEVKGLIAGGCPEVVLCGIRLGRYAVEGLDFAAMLKRLAAFPGDFRIRLSSLEITDMTDRLIDLIAASGGRICPSFHLPLQAGSDGVLRRMKRWYSTGFYGRRVEALRRALPRAGLFADVMAGFPGETDGEFEEGLDFMRSMDYSGLHVFRYSKRRGTPAARLPQVPEETIKERARTLRDLDSRLRARFAERAVGSTRRVVMEKTGLDGLAEDFLPVRVAQRPGPGFHSVRIGSSRGPIGLGSL